MTVLADLPLALAAHLQARAVDQQVELAARAAEILRRPDPALEGASLLEIMLRDGLPGIAQVRAHLVARITR